MTNTIFIKKISPMSIDFKVFSDDKLLTSGITTGFLFDEANKVFTATRLRVSNVACLVFDF